MVNALQDVGRAERVQVAFFQLQRDDALTAGRLYVRYYAAFCHPPFGADDLNPVVTQFGYVQPFPKGQRVHFGAARVVDTPAVAQQPGQKVGRRDLPGQRLVFSDDLVEYLQDCGLDVFGSYFNDFTSLGRYFPTGGNVLFRMNIVSGYILCDFDVSFNILVS